MKKTIFLFILLQYTFSNVYSQPDFDQVISKRILSSSKLQQGYLFGNFFIIDHIEIVSLNYYFETLPTVNYDLKKASYVPAEIQLDGRKFPNCTNTEQNYTETFKLTMTLKKTVQFTKTEVSSNKFSFGFKIPIFEKGEISLGSETFNSTTIGSSATTETSEIREYGRNLPVKIPPMKVTILKGKYTRGVIRVPFDAHCKVAGTVSIKYFIKHPIIRIVMELKPAMTVNLSEFLSDENRQFDFEGYVTNDNSSEIELSFADRPIIDSTDCNSNLINTKNIEDELIYKAYENASISNVQSVILTKEEMNEESKLKFKKPMLIKANVRFKNQ